MTSSTNYPPCDVEKKKKRKGGEGGGERAAAAAFFIATNHATHSPSDRPGEEKREGGKRKERVNRRQGVDHSGGRSSISTLRLEKKEGEREEGKRGGDGREPAAGVGIDCPAA